jgi:hypothetical protein
VVRRLDAVAVAAQGGGRAMHSFVRKFPEYGLVGGKGRGILYLYEVADPLSAFWARLSVARGFVSRSEAQRLMEAER